MQEKQSAVFQGFWQANVKENDCKIMTLMKRNALQWWYRQLNAHSKV